MIAMGQLNGLYNWSFSFRMCMFITTWNREVMALERVAVDDLRDVGS